jgi:uncharacterized phage protein (TIGR01671 family)
MNLKFRAWDLEYEKMVGVDIINLEDGKLDFIGDGITYFRKAKDIELMQSTGLTDKNGKEIFEGDILGTDGGLLDGVVEYRTDLGMWTNSLLRYNNFERLCSIANSREIIGNILEDGELLDGENTEEN